jgi:hypothetical protein
MSHFHVHLRYLPINIIGYIPNSRQELSLDYALHRGSVLDAVGCALVVQRWCLRHTVTLPQENISRLSSCLLDILIGRQLWPL